MRLSWLCCAVVATVLVATGCGTPPSSPAAHARLPAPAQSTVAPSAGPSSASPSSTSPSGASPSASAPSRVQVVGLGDSVTSGEHCDCDDYVTGFGHLLARHSGARVYTVDDGESGSTSDGLADELAGRSADERHLQADVADADVVVITMGANDLSPTLEKWRAGSCTASCYGPEVEQMQTDLGRVLDRVDALGDGHARILVTNYWNVFIDGRVARDTESRGYLAWSDTVTRQANSAIAQVTATHGATLVNLYTPFKGDGSTDPTDLLASDGDHPDEAGTATISRAVLTAYEARH